MCFLQLDHVNVYYGQDYRSKYKAPTDYCLALKVKDLYCHILCSGPVQDYSETQSQKLNSFNFLGQHPQIQKKSQYIKYLCCDDVRTLHQWVNGIRIAKVGFNLSLCYVLSRLKTFLIMHTKIMYLLYCR